MSEDKAIARRENGRALAAGLMMGAPVEGMEDLKPADIGLRPPTLRIVHPSSLKRGDERKPGQFQLGKIVSDDFVAVFLKAMPFRELGEGEGASRRTTCASIDKRHPLPGIAEPKSAECPSCPYAQWDDKPDGGRKAPPCQEGIAFLAVASKHQNLPFWFTVKKASIRVGQEFLRDVRMYPRSSPDEMLGLYQFEVRLTTKEERNGGVVWFTPLFTGRRMEPGEWGPFREMYLAARDVLYVPYVDTDESQQEEAEKDVTPAADGAAVQMPF